MDEPYLVILNLLHYSLSFLHKPHTLRVIQKNVIAASNCSLRITKLDAKVFVISWLYHKIWFLHDYCYFLYRNIKEMTKH